LPFSGLEEDFFFSYPPYQEVERVGQNGIERTTTSEDAYSSRYKKKRSDTTGESQQTAEP